MSKNTLHLKKLLLLSIFLAISFIIARWQIPLPIPPYNFLKFDLSEAPLIAISFLYPEYTLVIVLTYAILALIIYNPLGALFKIVAVTSLVIPLGLTFYYLKPSKPFSSKWKILVSIFLAVVSRIVVMIGLNFYMLEIKQIWPGVSMPVWYYILILPLFNLTQSLLNAIVAYATTSYLKQIITGEH